MAAEPAVGDVLKSKAARSLLIPPEQNKFKTFTDALGVVQNSSVTLKAMAFLQPFINFLKWLLPVSAGEFFLFTVTILLFIILVILYNYSVTQSRVREQSRCYQDRTKFRNNGTYTVTANDGANTKLYTLSYNIGAKDFSFDCDCPKGQSVNKFKDIRIYNQKTNRADVMDKTCFCDKDYVSGGSATYYTGFPDLARFMSSGDASFFANSAVAPVV